MEIQVQESSAHIVIVTIENQPRRNAMTRQMMAELAAVWDRLEHSPVRCIILTPTGKPPPLAVRLAKALPFQRAQVEMRDALTVHDGLHTADGAHAQAPWSPVRRQGTDDVMTHTQRPQGGRAFRPFLHVAGPLWGPSSNYPLCG
jgi:hypothetical protein